MATLISKTDLELELQTTFATSYTDGYFTAICGFADDMLQLKTNRAAFTGIVASIAKYAEICLAIDRMVTSNRDIVKSAISSISENGGNITFSNGKTIESYRKDADQIIADLKLPGIPKYGLTFADPAGAHTSTDPGMFDEV